MKNLLKIAGLFAVLTASTTLPAQAMHGQQEYVVVFYDDENHTNIVGHNVVYCDGHFVHVGARTLYTDEIYYGCN
ncbi:MULTISPECIES: DUF6289 family protein [unclassified Sphingomonas]|uniref:DUF6289 family protein n=1 Tax=unclassified Sphingomonas TaxID=196159 RepID=UPI0022B401F5|nr:DUF6289 family protein [Sphingomonas sp. NIBR02145]WHU03046.1 DUF6289 family protein [Sphingomonas sp. NIBR02145]